MRISFSSFIFIGAAALALSPNLSAQVVQLVELLDKNGPGGPAPTHDLFGAWAARRGGDRGVQKAASPYTPAGEAAFKLHKPGTASAKTNDPWMTCDPFGFPRDLTQESNGYTFSQMPGRIVITNMYNRTSRIIWMDGRALPKNVGAPGAAKTRWYGYSVGHWDGDNKLVVNTNGTMDDTWLDQAGHPHSTDMLVEEQYTRPSFNIIQLVATVDDPKYYTKPWVVARNTYRWIPPDFSVYGTTGEYDEEFCVPSEMIRYNETIRNLAQ
jgi:hypothetical protein